MALEELIIAWSKERPRLWQRKIIRHVAAGDTVSQDPQWLPFSRPTARKLLVVAEN